MTTTEDTAVRPDAEAERDRLAAAAFANIRKGHHWADWRFLAVAFEAGRNRAMREAGSNKPLGRPYNEAFARWMDEPHRREWARGIDKATRNHLLWVAENLPSVEQWRDTLAANQRDRINHPSIVKRAYEAAHLAEAIQAAGMLTPSPMAQLKDKLVSLQEENDRLKRQSGSLFDLVKDTPSTIAMVVVETVAASRAESIAREIVKAVKAKKSAHAG